MEDIKFLPGHRKRFEDMLQEMREQVDLEQENVDNNIVENESHLDNKLGYLKDMVDELQKNFQKKEKVILEEHSILKELDSQNQSNINFLDLEQNTNYYLKKNQFKLLNRENKKQIRKSMNNFVPPQMEEKKELRLTKELNTQSVSVNIDQINPIVCKS